MIKMNDQQIEQLLSLEDNENKSKNKKGRKKKLLIGTFGGIGSLAAIFLFMFYGPWSGFRNLWITTAMTNMNHRYLATSLNSDEKIRKD